jgi:hypothetical protein
MVVEHFQGSDGPSALELGDLRLACLCKADEIAQRGDARRELVIVEQDPAPDLAALGLALGAELARELGQVIENDPRLAETHLAVGEHRRLAHFIHLGAIFGAARLAVEIVNHHRLPRKDGINPPCMIFLFTRLLAGSTEPWLNGLFEIPARRPLAARPAP